MRGCSTFPVGPGRVVDSGDPISDKVGSDRRSGPTRSDPVGSGSFSVFLNKMYPAVPTRFFVRLGSGDPFRSVSVDPADRSGSPVLGQDRSGDQIRIDIDDWRTAGGWVGRVPFRNRIPQGLEHVFDLVLYLG